MGSTLDNPTLSSQNSAPLRGSEYQSKSWLTVHEAQEKLAEYVPWILIRITLLKQNRLRHSGPQPYGVTLTNKFKLWTHAKTIFKFCFGTLGDMLDQTALRHLHIYKGRVQSRQLPDGPKAHLARWPQTNGQITSFKQLPYGQTS